MTLDDRIVTDLKDAFNEHAEDGKVSKDKMGDVFKSAGEPIPAFKLRELFQEGVESLSFDQFLNLFEKMDLSKSWGAKLRQNVQAKGGLIQISGSEQSADGTVHSMSDAECWSFSNFINRLLKDDKDLKELLPVNPENHELFQKVQNGILICKLINCAVPNTIDERAINKTKLSKFTINENLNLAINSASSIGCHVVNIGANDIYEGKAHLILGMVWQVIRIKLLSAINLKSNPNLICLLREGETLEQLLALSPEELLIRWVNYQLDKTSCPVRMTNFQSDIKDSVIYSHLMDSVVPRDSMLYDSSRVLSSSDNMDRAKLVIQNAEKADCAGLATPYDIVTGNQKLNMAFVANLFNIYPNLEVAEEAPVIEETREEKTYRNWMNSLGVKPQVNWIYSDLSDGLILLKLHDIIHPGSVNWDKVNKGPFKGPSSKIKMIENCNMVVDLGKKAKLSLVGIAGDDIHNGTKTLCLANLWQMMRLYTLKILQDLSANHKPITDAEIVEWANGKLSDKGLKISSFKDSSLVSSVPILELIDAMSPGSVNKSYIKPGVDDEERLLNAQYAISMARKIGARVYALPEDIVEMKNKMIMTIFACLMAKDLSK